MGVSKNRDTPKWMVKIMENPIKMDDLGVPLFLETSIYPIHGKWNKSSSNLTSYSQLTIHGITNRSGTSKRSSEPQR